jgi:hypothetical protein
LIGYIFDVTSMGEFFGPKGQFSTYASKDISYTLAKFSNLAEDADVVGYGGLSAKELEVLDDWVSLFLCV